MIEMGTGDWTVWCSGYNKQYAVRIAMKLSGVITEDVHRVLF
jgi:hypothetical protein